IVCEDNSSFAGRDQLARLETESCCAAKRANSLSPPFAGVSMRTVLHQGNTAVASDFAQTIEIGWVSAHMYRDDGFCPLGNARSNSKVLVPGVRHQTRLSRTSVSARRSFSSYMGQWGNGLVFALRPPSNASSGIESSLLAKHFSCTPRDGQQKCFSPRRRKH